MKILFVGLGDLGSQTLDLFVRVPGKHHFLVGGRNLDVLQQRTNLSLFAAIQLERYPEVTCISMDLWNVEQTAQTIAHVRPDLVFCSATVLRWGAISSLPKPLADHLYEAGMGPWLPVHLVLVYRLMQAIEQSGLAPIVINATYPDVTNPLLAKVGLAPSIGIGDLANNVPALRRSIALKLKKPVEEIDIRFFTQRYLSHRMARAGNAGGAPFHLTVLVKGEDVTRQLDMETVFDQLPTIFKRAPGQQMTAASAMTVFEAIITDTETITHAPGPIGLPGGYPILVNAHDIGVVLPDGLTMQEAVDINEACMRFDGIERIDEDGTVSFTERNMSILKEVLDYECKCMPLSEADQWAAELRSKFLELVSSQR